MDVYSLDGHCARRCCARVTTWVRLWSDTCTGRSSRGIIEDMRRLMNFLLRVGILAGLETVSFDCKADGAWNMCVRIVRRTLLSTLYKSGEMGLKGF